jgi:hypothetical protein
VLEREMAEQRRRLLELWRLASPADRLFAVDRLLRETVLPGDVQRQLQVVQDAVRDAWVTARVAKVLKDKMPADARVASLQYSLSERVRDAFLDQHELYDRLFLVAEGYFRTSPLTQGTPTFRDLWRRREILLAEMYPILPPVEDSDEAVANREPNDVPAAPRVDDVEIEPKAA